MTPLITLVSATLLLRAAGAAGLRPLRSWRTALRGGLAAMFVLTGTAHFNHMRDDLVAMVPPALPQPELLVTLTGLLELLGAAGLLHRRTAPWAAAGLTVLLVAMFPANVHAAAAGLTVNGQAATALLPRTLIQLAFIMAAAAVWLPAARKARRAPRARTP
ncbi:DoxX family membrane protein [Arthrobacter deserti]|uniref:DoxX family membrane protein n=1 Tax=Arthrobacter deserti TaxID=1742687 RepID=A0ABX1JNR7_9MICC|nr:DoxX family membrane protein [Arthrobacter deserti]